MKSIIALALFVSVALCNSTAHYGWIPNHELTFRWTTSQITGLEDIRAQYGGMELSSIIRVQVFSDYSLRIKFENSKFGVVNKDLPIVHGRPQIPEGSQELPEEFRRPLETAFMVHLKAGVIENLFVERDEPVVVTNIKKALLSQLQMDLSASRRQDIGSNEISKSIMSDERPTFFTTEESSILGDCETIYTVNPLSKYQANELESRWIEVERELRELGILSGPKSEGDEACRGKTYYEVTKTRNFDNCRERPVFQQWIGLKSSCDVTKSNCKDMFTHLSSTRYIVCGSEEQFYIREANTENSIVSQPIGWNTEETLKSTARITLVLIKVKSGDFTPVPKPNQPKEKKSLVYQYPKANDRLSPEEATREVVPGTEGQSPFMPILPKPDMRSASNLIPNPIAKNELKTKIVEEIKDIVNKIHDETQSCANKGDVASYISTVVQSLRSLNYYDLKEIDHKITSSFSHGSQLVTAVEIFEDMLAMVGSNPCVLLLKEKIQGGRMESRNKAYLVGNAIRNVRTPTEELFKELFQMVKFVKGDRQAYQSGLLELSNLVYLACVNPSTSYNQYPVRIYGRFCKPESSFITEHYIPYLEQQLQNRNSEKDVEQFVYISALGKLGHKNTVLPLTRVIEGKMSSKPMARSMAVYSLKRLAKLEPTMVRPVLLALIDNLAEHTEVRIAAVAVLPWSQPSVAELQKMALRSWFEPSKQVASFMYSTLKYLPQTEVPELKPVGLKAKTLLHLVKPFQYGIQFSHNIYSQKFVEYLRTAASSQLRYVITEESFIPTRVSFSTKLFGGLWEIRGLSFAIYTESMDKVMDKVFDYLGYKSEVTDKVEEQLNKVNEELKIQDRHGRTPAAMAQLKMLGFETFYALDVKTYIEILNLVSEKLRGAELSEGQTFQKTRLQNLLNLESFGPSEAGFLLYVRKTVPVVLAYKGSYSTSTGSLESRDSEKYFKAEVKPIANIKVETTFGVVSPFTKQFIGAGVEMGFHANGCSAVKAEINKPGQLTLTLKKPEQVNTKVELIHVFVKPYTFTRDLTRLVPTFKDSSAKAIMSTNLIKQEFKLGERFGVDLNAKFATDYRHFDFGYVINKMSYQNIQSAFHTGLMVPSIRYFSFQLVWDVEASQTKEIRTRISSVRGQHVEGGDLELLSEEGVSQEEHLRRICGESYRTQSEAEICHRQALGQLERAAETVTEICEEQSESGSLSDEKKRECRKAVHVCEQAKRICEESRRYEREICQDKKDQCLSKRRTIQHMERALQGQQTGSGRVHGLNFESSLRSAYHGERKVEVMGVFGRKVSNNNKDIKAFVDVKMTTPEHPVYEMEAISETKLPEVMYRWNLDSLLKEDINMKNRIVIKFGRQSADKHTIELKTNWEKTEAQKEAVCNSPEFKKCNEEFQANRMLSSVCMEARHQAASVDKVQFKIQAPFFHEALPVGTACVVCG
ncbi:hypothetical protein TCAL_06577 [Tigriopus californicus]|uniref:Vitellogenin domain-containing protein n=1 Tax=Tigriopus californicus TaxID=6832 RepID=A0A553P4D0_TIGCA|nr:hypothetical protein TCAL_06577 [Tigriopus californicus]|eukprot:TCALIF_06577-PA protein Name:"Similar to Vg Vitellogenin (Apis mellifera)" AED:0.01 eAED:0.01 QI:69/1/0.6/1/1/1/5/0/1439